MPGNRGIDGLTAIRNQFPDVLVLLFLPMKGIDVIVRALAFGASAYVPLNLTHCRC